MPDVSALAYVTPDLTGTGGVLRDRPEDFLVEEQPLYTPAGEGEHLYLFIEKRQTTTTDVGRRLARAFQVKRSDVGWAGLKDKHAVTRQHFSIWLPKSTNEQTAEGLERFAKHPQTQVLWAERHTNKLRRGHHGGNRFVIRLRELEPTIAAVRARPILQYLAQHGMPNYFGEQRFGYRGEGHTLGILLLRGQWQAFLDCMLGDPRDIENDAVQAARRAYDAGDFDQALEHLPKGFRAERQALDALRQGRSPMEAVRSIEVSAREFLITAAQSAVFNAVADARVQAGTLGQIMPGDLAWKHDNRAVFAVDEATAALENSPEGRVGKLEISPSGPAWGREMTRASGAVDDAEVAALTEAGLSPEDFDAAVEQPELTTPGSRRPLRERVVDPDLSAGVDEHGPYLRLAFELARGSFATVVLREIMKSSVPSDI